MADTSEHTIEHGGLAFHMYTTSPAGLLSNSVLIAGEKDAVLIDTAFTISDAAELIERVKSTGKQLKALLITHAHPDHYAGMPQFQKAFPDTPILARQGVIDGIIEWPAKKLHWQDSYGDSIATDMVLPSVLTGDHMEMEGRTISFIDVPPAETVHATAFHLPELGALIAGDLLYENTHLYMADTNNPASWLAAVEKVRQIGKIDTIFPGHGRAGGVEIMDITAAWLDYYREIAKPGVRFTEIATAMRAKFPDYALPIVLWLTRGPAFGLAGPVASGVPAELLG